MNFWKSIFLTTSVLAMTTANAAPIFNLFELGIQPDKVSAYDAVGESNIRQSITNESGTLAMYSVRAADNPNLAYMVEIYADDAAYQVHLKSPQYQAFLKKSPEILTVHKQRIELNPVYLGEKAKPITKEDNTITNLVRVTVNTKDTEAYRQRVMTEIQESIKVEEGVLAIYAATAKAQPEKWYFFEIYANKDALQQHRETAHFKTYLEQTQGMLNDRQFSEVTPVLLMNQGGLNFMAINK